VVPVVFVYIGRFETWVGRRLHRPHAAPDSAHESTREPTRQPAE
jgi:hypothetical protein